MAEENNTTPLPNSPEARTPTGELKDLQAETTTSSETSPSSESKTDGQKTESTGAPETYEEFKAADGQTLDKSVVEKATPIFKELGLTQAQAQKLVDFYSEQNKTQADLAVEAVKSMRKEWVDQVKADKDMSGKLDSILTDIGRMKDEIFGNDSKARTAFEEALNVTGAGDHPAFVKTLWKISQKLNEGSYVSGDGPSKHGQSPGKADRPSAAHSLYPNLA